MSAAEKPKHSPAANMRSRGAPVQRQALLAHPPADHGHRPGGTVVVVKAGVVVVHPADQPRGQVLVADQLRVVALRGVVCARARSTARAWSASSPAKRLQLLRRQVAPAGRGGRAGTVGRLIAAGTSRRAASAGGLLPDRARWLRRAPAGPGAACRAPGACSPPAAPIGSAGQRAGDSARAIGRSEPNRICERPTSDSSAPHALGAVGGASHRRSALRGPQLRAAAGPQPLGVQWGEPGEHREDRPAAAGGRGVRRWRRPAMPPASGPRSTVSAGHHSGSRGPGRRRRRRACTPGAGMHEQRRAQLLQAREDRAELRVSARVRRAPRRAARSRRSRARARARRRPARDVEGIAPHTRSARRARARPRGRRRSAQRLCARAAPRCRADWRCTPAPARIPSRSRTSARSSASRAEGSST